MDLAMVTAAQRYCKFVADLASQRPRLRKAQVMSVGRSPAANQTRLLSHCFDVLPIANATRLGQSEYILVDTP